MRLSPRLRSAARWTVRIGLGLTLVTVLLALVGLRGALYDHFVRFPKQEAAWAAIRADRHPVPADTGWKEFKGVLHSHSHLSHDSQVPFEDIVAALTQADRDFIFLSDHCTEGRADFSAQWRGVHRGKLFIPGFEMKEGNMPFGVRAGVVLSNQMDPQLLAERVIENGGVLFYAHPEEPRVWERPQLTGMEIYNVHADFKDEGGLTTLLPNLLINQRRYPEQVLRSIFDRPEANLRRWDALNQQRHITGVAGNDCHQNTGVRLFVLDANTLRAEDTSPKKIADLKLNAVTRWLAHLCCGPITPGRELFKVQLDPYARMTRFVTTHLLAADLTEASLLDALKAGRAFVGFDLLADSTGFVWRAQSGSARVTMGESMPWAHETRLRAAAPHRCRFTVVKDGVPAHQAEGLQLDWSPPGPGLYRVEAELNVVDEWTPWIYSNPIWLR